MKGIFLRKKFCGWLLVLFLCGLFFIGLYFLLNAADSKATDKILSFLIVGGLICLAAIASWLLNFRAFICVDENYIKAKYHWFGKIDCKISDVDFAVARVNTLIIQLKDGKCHTIMGIENPWELSSVIRRNMSFEVTEKSEMLIEKLNNLKSAKKNAITYVCFGTALMFINIFIAVFLTGEKDLYEFSQTDWIIFAVMGGIETVTIILTFYFAQKAGKNNLPIEKMQYAIKKSIIETAPLLPGNVIKVFTNEDYTGRITFFGFPNEKTVYYTVEQVAPDYTLVKIYDSEIFESFEMLSDQVEALLDITKSFERELLITAQRF